MARKTANDVAADLRVHEKMCEERWKTISELEAYLIKE